MKFEFKNAVLPCNEKEDFNKVGEDIVCRIYLYKAPCKRFENRAKEIDGENYRADCFFIETIVGKDNLNEEFITGGWYLYYVDDNGDFYTISYVHDDIDDIEAWEFFEKEIGVKFYGEVKAIIH